MNSDHKCDISEVSLKISNKNIFGLSICAALTVVAVIILVTFTVSYLYSNEKQIEKHENRTLESNVMNISNDLITANIYSLKANSVDCKYSISKLNKDLSVFGHLPWEISLTKYKHFCIASIISKNWALTAAHCFDEIGQPTESTYLKVLVHSSQMTKQNESVNKRRAIKIIKHPLYNDDDVVNDIAVILVDPPFEYRFHGQGMKTDIAPVCLPDENEQFLNREVFISGIARREQNSTVDILISSATRIIEDAYCLNVFGKRYKFQPPSHICASLPRNKIGPCKGDSGGPVVVIEQERVKQIGLISFGRKCSNNTPSVLTNVAFYRSWLREQTGL